MVMKGVRKALALGSIIVGGTAITIPDATISKMLIAFATSLNAASLYLLKEEQPNETKELKE